mmetsp:Transcript_101865/g.197126  ORF Transcript_101865/g.197126 Transcript_101865/m.197126 type:complete len:667 (-) Transcript_101865:51-2051(-)
MAEEEFARRQSVLSIPGLAIDRMDSNVPTDYQTKNDVSARTSKFAYGTIDQMTISARLFELDTYIGVMKKQTLSYFGVALIAAAFWPLGGLLAFPLNWLGNYLSSKTITMGALIFGLAFVVGGFLWLVPIVLFAGEDGLSAFWKLRHSKQIVLHDITDFLTSAVVILLAMIFSWVYHEIAIDLEKYKERTKTVWKSKRSEVGMSCAIADEQAQVLWNELDMAPNPENPSEGMVPLQGVLQILETLPGFAASHSHTLTDHYRIVNGKSRALSSILRNTQAEASVKGLWAIDIFLVREQYAEMEDFELWKGLRIVYRQTKDMCHWICLSYWRSPAFCVLFILLALARAILPRFWLWYVLGGEMWPDTLRAQVLVGTNVVMQTLVFAFWLSLFYVVLDEYKRNVAQVTILSALVDPRMRVKYSERFLMSMMEFNLSPEEGIQVLSKLPLLSLQNANNAAAWWRLREYVTLDRANERIAIELFLEILVIWLGIKFVVTFWVMKTTRDGVPALLAVTMFDIIVFGLMMLWALQVALRVNDRYDRHKRILVEAKYHVSNSLASIDPDRPQAEDLKLDLLTARRLLSEYLEMVQEYDHRDAILLGQIVTPAKVLSAAATVAGSFMTLYIGMMKSGRVKVPEVMEDITGEDLPQFTGVAAMYSNISMAFVAFGY